jgi:hypothetical protein
VKRIEEFDLELVKDRSNTSAQISLDYTKWTTPKKYAEEIGVQPSIVHTWIHRGSITFERYPELNDFIVVKRGSETVKKNQ